MSNLAIRVDCLSKKYKIGVARQRHNTLRDAITDALTSMFRFNGRGSASSAQCSAPSDTIWALKDVSFEINHGEVVGFIGKNGAGKSTLFKILSRITEPTTGKVEIFGRVGSLLEVGTGFNGELTGRDNVYLNGAILGMKKWEIDHKFDEIVAFAEIEKFIDTPVKRYSSGMYVRLAFAVAAHLDPEILILDEVLAVGDVMFQEKCMGKIQHTAHSGKTVLVVSHNMDTMQHLCDRAMLLKSGEVTVDGSPEEVVQSYLTESVSAPLGGSTSLHDWPDRESNGQARIVLLEIANGDGKLSGSIAVGSRICFRIHAEFHEPTTNPCFGVVIHGRSGEPFLDLRSSHAGIRVGTVKGQAVVEVSVDSLGLYPGEYFVSPWIFDRACRESLDWPKLCCKFRVTSAGSVHGDLKLEPAWGKYWVPSNWNVKMRP